MTSGSDGRNHWIRNGRHLLAAVFLAMAAAPPVFAKTGPHRSSNDKAATAMAGRHSGAASKSAAPAVAATPQPADAGPARSAPATAPPRAGAKIIAPSSPPAGHGSAAPQPVARNAIGQPLPPRPNAAVSFSAADPAPPPARVVHGMTDGSHPAALPQGPASGGRLDGSALIRPASAPSALGGPARTVAGINGTTMRTRH